MIGENHADLSLPPSMESSYKLRPTGWETYIKYFKKPDNFKWWIDENKNMKLFITFNCLYMKKRPELTRSHSSRRERIKKPTSPDWYIHFWLRISVNRIQLPVCKQGNKEWITYLIKEYGHILFQIHSNPMHWKVLRF